MRTQIQRQENVSRTIQSKTKAANQANVHSVLQKYAARSVQRQADDGLEEDLIQGKFETAQLEGVEDEEPLQGRFETAQREGVEDEEPLQGKFSGAIQREESVPTKNETGIPDNMKAGFENLSGFSFDDVRVHYNSDKPAQLQALAYTQGNQVHIAPGQEKHLGHELGHVVQQKQGRVQPTMQLQGVSVNDDEGLEREADESSSVRVLRNMPLQKETVSNGIIQRVRTYVVEDIAMSQQLTYADIPVGDRPESYGRDAITRCTDVTRAAIDSHKKNVREKNAKDRHGGVALTNHKIIELNAAIDAVQVGGVMNRLQKDEALIIVAHGAPPTRDALPTLGNFTPNQLADALISMGIFPNEYSGDIYLDGCNTATNSSPDKRDSFALRFKLHLIGHHIGLMKVFGNGGFARTSHTGHVKNTINPDYMGQSLGRQEV